MDDTFKLDLADHERSYIEETLEGFIDGAGGYGRKVVAIRMSRAIFLKLEIGACPPGGSFRDVPVIIVENDHDRTIEVILGPLH